ncbi:AAA family ATPase [Promicromonospora thailandica]|nr:AAA family ATPase [Promicromonospora thailandica]
MFASGSTTHARALGHRLEAARRRAFVGRAAEIAAFRAALADAAASTVLFVHGAGGTGKTALLRRFVSEAENLGRRVVRTGPYRAASSLNLLRAELALLAPPGHEADDGAAPPVLLVDDFDGWAEAETCLREALLPTLPVGTVVVLAGRRPPGLEWTTDPGWQELLSVHELGDLSLDEARLLLDRRSVPRDRHDVLLAVADGNPLALLVATDALGAGASDDDVRLAVAHVVLDRVVGELPSPAHRRALELCAANQPATEATLAPLSGLVPGPGAPGAVGDPTELFRWLRSLPFVEAEPGGLRVRPFVCQAIGTEWRWRGPAPDGASAAAREVAPAGPAARRPRAGRAPAAAPTVAPVAAPDRDAFESEVREALRSWRRPDLLAKNPLVRTRMVAERPEKDRVAALRHVLQEALDEMSQDPREAKSHRALVATYLGGAPTQEAAAERLGLPFSTYRRHLGQGLAVLVSLLWWRETRGEHAG